MALDAEIDRLYRLPPGEFTAARNDLAKRAGPRAAEVRKLAKPPLAAWAVNQLYWSDRKIYDALVESAEASRATHKAVLSGRRGDLRASGREHETAVDTAFKATLALLGGSGHPLTDATRQAVGQTLRALPADDPPGRLTRALQPGGFEMLAGVNVRPSTRSARAGQAPSTRSARAGQATKEAADKDGKDRETREAATAAARAVREAEHEAKRTEFESARAARAAARADEQLAAAREEFEAARTRVAEADAEVTKTKRQLGAARRAAQAAERAVTVARKRAERLR